MANLKKSAGDLIAELSAAARQEILDTLRPRLDKITSAIAELESAIKSGGKPRAQHGRPRKGTAGRPAAGKRIPRGALKESVRAILAGAPEGIKLASIRDRLMRKALFRHRNSKTIYAQIVHAVQTIDGAHKTGRGTYALGAAGAAPKKAGRAPRRSKKKKE